MGLRFEELSDVGMRIGALPCLPASLDVEESSASPGELQEFRHQL